MRGSYRIAAAVLTLALLGGGGWTMRSHEKQDPTGRFRTVPVKHCDLRALIGATGTVEPEEVVDVGAQVAGQVSTFGKDEGGMPIDYGSEVGEGTVLARIDDALYAADVASAKAALEQAQANQLSAEANLVQVQAKLVQAQQDWDRAQKLGPSEALAQSAYDSYKAAYEIAKANVGVGQAAIEQSKAVDLSTQLYRQGQTDFLNVLVAERALATAEDAWVQSERSITTDVISLYKALGGGWDSESHPGMATGQKDLHGS